jgi:DNA-binding NtrC family response regulator
LRERREDLPLLVRYDLRRFSRELGRDVQEVAPEVLERLCDYSWPGNIRELQSVPKQALLRASGPILLPAFLPEFTGTPSGPRPAAPGAGADLGLEGFIRQRLTPGGARPLRRNPPSGGPALLAASWSIRKAISKKPPACWALPEKPCDTNFAT